MAVRRATGSPLPAARWLQRADRPPPPKAVTQAAAFQRAAALDGRGEIAGSHSTVLFIDGRSEHLEQTLETVHGRARTVLLDGDSDGLAQMAFHLRERRAIERVLIAAADERGQLTLGGCTLTVGNLYAYEDDLRRIGSALAPTGRICLLGRRTQSEGIDRPLLVMLSRMTNVPVEALAEPAWAFPWTDWENAPRYTPGSRHAS